MDEVGITVLRMQENMIKFGYLKDQSRPGNFQLLPLKLVENIGSALTLEPNKNFFNFILLIYQLKNRKKFN